GHRTGAVIGHAIHQNGSAPWAIAFIADFFEVGTVAIARAALNGALDVVFGHVGGGGFVPGEAQTRIGIRIGPAVPSCHRDFTNNFRPELAAFGILPAFAVLDVCPFTVSGH